jgi:hypothetical protein
MKMHLREHTEQLSRDKHKEETFETLNNVAYVTSKLVWG